MTDSNDFLSTEELASTLKVKAPSIRVRLCNTGSYHGLTPIKLPSKRLMWPLSQVQDFLAGKPVQGRKA
jgi:hypothetical protein